MSGYDYQAFANGRLAEVLSGNRERMVWAKKAGTLRAALSESELQAANGDIQAKAWLEVAKILRAEIQELDPNSEFANKGHLNDLYHAFADQFAAERGLHYDEDGYLGPKP